MSRTSFRRGVSLMEVLISIFVLSVGLLGIAALIPLGRFTIVEASKADRSGACGRAAIRDVKVRRLLDRTAWVDYAFNYILPCYDSTGTVKGPATNTPNPLMPRVPALGAWVDAEENRGWYTSYCIDPLLISRWPADGNLMRFPNHVQPNVITSTASGYTQYYPTMRRVTLRPLYSINSQQQQAAAAGFGPADRLFTWSDDLSFELPADRGQRPRQFLRFINGTAGTYPPLYPSEPGSTATPTDLLSKMSDGAYSWIITVTPALSEMNQASAWPNRVNLPSRQLYNVSAVVFYKRLLERPIRPDANTVKPTERVALVETASPYNFPGYGGGDVVLRVRKADLAVPTPEYLDVVPGTWILLAGQVPYTDVGPTGTVGNPVANVFKWYKVESVGEVRTSPSDSNYLERRVTLEGPDFFWRFRNSTTGAYEPTMNTATLRAILVDNVVGVYTITSELDVDPGSIRYSDFYRSSQY